jgi:hypothetical protein
MAESERDTRGFQERVSRLNAAFLVSVPTKELAGRFAQLVEEAANETGAKLIYTLVSSQRLRLDYDRPDERDERRPPRRKFSFGGGVN